MSADQEQIFSFSVPGIDEPVTVPVAKRKSFLDANPGAVERRRYRVPGIEESVWIPDGKPVPEGAERVYRFRDAGGETYNVPRSKLGAHIDARKAPDKDRSWGSYAGEAYADAPKAVGRTIAAAGAGVVQDVGGTLADLGPGDAARRERQRALDAAPERIPTMKEAGREIGLSQAEIDALPDRPVTLRDLDDPRFGQAYRDRVRATMRRVAENAPETEAEKAHREEAERLQAKADKLSAPLMEPRNAAERAAMHFGGGVATVGELGLAAALGGPAAVPLWMGATGAAREAARQEAEGASPREAMVGAIAPAAAESLAWTVPLPIGPGATAAGRVGREALTMGVKSDLAGTARRTLSGEEAPALSDRLAEDLGAAAMGGAIAGGRDAVRYAASAPRRAAARAAADLAAMDPAGSARRMEKAATRRLERAQEGIRAEKEAVVLDEGERFLKNLAKNGAKQEPADPLAPPTVPEEPMGPTDPYGTGAAAPYAHPSPTASLPAVPRMDLGAQGPISYEPPFDEAQEAARRVADAKERAEAGEVSRPEGVRPFAVDPASGLSPETQRHNWALAEAERLAGGNIEEAQRIQAELIATTPLPGAAEPGAVPTPPLVPAEIPTAVRVPDAVRNYVPPTARDLERREADAARLAEEELATREAPQVAVDEVPPTVPPNISEQVRTTPNDVPPAPAADSVAPAPNDSEQARTSPNGVVGSATPPQARDPATFPISMDPRVGRKSIPGFVVPLDGELVPGAEVAFHNEFAGTPTIGKIVEDMGKALVVQPERGPQRIVTRDWIYGIRAPEVPQGRTAENGYRTPVESIFADYTAGMSPLAKTRAAKALLVKRNAPGNQTMAEFLLSHKDTKITAERDRRGGVTYIVPLGSQLSRTLNKTELDFAKHIGMQFDEESVGRAKDTDEIYTAMSRNPDLKRAVDRWTDDGWSELDDYRLNALRAELVRMAEYMPGIDKALKVVEKAVERRKAAASGRIASSSPLVVNGETIRGYHVPERFNPGDQVVLSSENDPSRPDFSSIYRVVRMGPKNVRLEYWDERNEAWKPEEKMIPISRLMAVSDKAIDARTPEPAAAAEQEPARPRFELPKTVREAVDRLAELEKKRKGLNGISYGFDESDRKMKAADDAERERLEGEIEIVNATLDNMRAPSVPLKPSGVAPTPNPKAAAKVVERFVAPAGSRPVLEKPYHDKGSGYVVATDGKRLIATRYGFDQNAPDPNGVYPNWKQVAISDGYGKDALREKLDVRALADMAEDADKLARAASVHRDLDAAVALRIGGKPVMVNAGFFADFLRAMEAHGISEVEWDGRGPLLARNGGVATIMLMPYRVGEDFQVQTGRNKGGGVLVDAATGRIVRAPGREDWRDDWKDERGKPKKDPAQSTLDRMAAAQDEIENRIMRRDEALRAMEGFGKRGVDPLATGTRGRKAPRGSVRADVAAEAPRAAGAPAPESPHEGLRTKLKVLVDSGATPEEMEAFAREAEAADAFATAALARQHAGTYRGTPWGTEGGDVWPAEPPPMAKLELGDMVDLARGLSSSGAVPKVVRRISRVLRGKAAGVFRASEGDAKSGKVELIGRLFGLVDADERASVERRATEKAEKTGADPDSPMYREAYRKAYEKGMADAIEGSMRSGPKRAMAVLAHEIGHWIDFLSEGDLKRGNVLGHIAALKRNAVQTLWRDPATAGLAGTTGWTERMREEVHRDVEKRVKRKDFASDEEYRDAYRAEMDAELLSRGLESHGVVREQMERLVAWFRQSDGAPEYFAKDPAELYAEAFSAWMNYPANARRLAPRFVQLMDDWIAAHGEAGRAVKRFQAMAAERSAAREAAAAAGGPTSDAEFFERRRKEGAAASMAEDPALRPVLSNDADPPSITRWTRRKAEFLNQAVGPRTMLEDMILGAPDAKNNPDAIPVFRALLDLDNSGNMARLWRYRFDSRVMPKLESAGIPLDDFRDYLKYSRLGNEITGPLQDRGAANKAGPGGVAPGYGATGARARVADLRAKYGPAIEDARRAFVQDVRRGADAGGEGSILGRLLDSPVLSEEQKRVLGNEWYVSLRRAMVPDTTREVSSGREMSNWNGIWSLRTGSLQETGDVIANTLLQDWTMFQQVMRQEARLRLVDYLKAHKPEWVGGEAEMKVVAGRDSDGNPFVQRVPKQQKKEGWRVVTFMRDGKAEGWWVPDFVAQALEPQTFAAEHTRGAREAEAAVAALSRASNAALTTANLVFNPINALSRDPNGLSRYALPRVGEGAKGAIYNTVGDASIAVRSLANDAATRMERGQYDPRVVHALASGALNDTASGWGPNGGTRGVAGMAEDIRRTGRAELTEDEVRRFWEGFGNRPERVNAALAREGSTWKKAAGAVAKAWGMGPGRLNEWLGRREMSSKAASLADLEARRPDLSPEERAWWVKNMMGTPDLSNRPLLDRNPYVRVLAPFFTPFAHGIRYQLLRAFQKMPGTLGRRLAAQMLPKAVAVAAPAALVAMALEAAQEADEMKKGGRFSEDAVQAKLDEAARLVAVGQAWAEIPLRHRMNGFTFPLPGGRYLYAPTDQGLLAVESAVLGGIVAPMAKQGGGWEGFAGAVNEAMPNFGPLPNTLVGLATGYDLNMGREVAGEREQHPAARTAGWAWDNLTGRGLGILPSATVERWITGDGPDAGEAAKRAYSWPFLSSIPGAFVRKRGSGAWAARAGAVRQGKAEEKEMRGEAAAGAAAAAEGDAERAQQAARRIAELGGDPQARLQSAAERRNLAGSDLSPSERLVVEKKGKLSDASREWLDPMAQAMLFMPEVWQRLHEKPAD